MFDARKLLDQFIGAAEKVAGKENIDKVRAGIENNPGLSKAAGIGLAAVVLGTRAGRSLGSRALKLGGVAVVGSLAWKAWQDWLESKQGKQPDAKRELAQPPADSLFAPQRGDAQERAKAFLSAMIASAKADGNIDADEQKRIFGKLNSMVDGAEAKAFLMEQMMAPLELDKIAELARDQAMAVEIYTASLLAIDIDHPAEIRYLAQLAERLGIDPELAKLLEKTVDEERAAG